MRILLRTLALTSLMVIALAAQPVGEWKVTAVDPDGNRHSATMTITGEGGKLDARIETSRGTIAAKEVTWDGKELAFQMPYDNLTLTIRMKLEGEALAGEFVTSEGDRGTLRATRAR